MIVVYVVLGIVVLLVVVAGLYLRVGLEAGRLISEALSDDPDADAVIDAADSEDLQRALESLPLHASNLVRLHIYHGFTARQIAEPSGRDPERIARQLAVLKALMAEHIRREQALRAETPEALGDDYRDE